MESFRFLAEAEPSGGQKVAGRLVEACGRVLRAQMMIISRTYSLGARKTQPKERGARAHKPNALDATATTQINELTDAQRNSVRRMDPTSWRLSSPWPPTRAICARAMYASGDDGGSRPRASFGCLICCVYLSMRLRATRRDATRRNTTRRNHCRGLCVRRLPIGARIRPLVSEQQAARLEPAPALVAQQAQAEGDRSRKSPLRAPSGDGGGGGSFGRANLRATIDRKRGAAQP